MKLKPLSGIQSLEDFFSGFFEIFIFIRIMTFLFGCFVFVLVIFAVVVSVLKFLISVISDLLCFDLLVLEIGLGVVVSNSGV